MQQMRPFNPQVEDINQYLEEAKERGIYIPNQDSLKQYADRVNKHNLDIVKRDEKAIQENRLKKKLEEDEIEEAKKSVDEKRLEKMKDFSSLFL